jgi:hypothetical protein
MPYRIFMLNHFRDANGGEHDLYYWDAAKRAETAQALTALYQRVCAGTRDRAVTAGFLRGTPEAWEPVLHIVESRGESLIAARGFDLPTQAGGNTFWANSREMISEVYVRDNRGTNPETFAKLMFHELMHNKLDAHTSPRLRSVRDIHAVSRGQIGLATAGSLRAARLTPWNITMMRRTLRRAIPQLYAPALGVNPPQQSGATP